MPSAGRIFGAALLNSLGKGVEGAQTGYDKARDYALKQLTEKNRQKGYEENAAYRNATLANQRAGLGFQREKFQESNKDEQESIAIETKIQQDEADPSNWKTDPNTGKQYPTYPSISADQLAKHKAKKALGGTKKADVGYYDPVPPTSVTNINEDDGK